MAVKKKIETRGRPRRDKNKTICKFYRVWFTNRELEAFENYCEINASTPAKQIDKFIKSIINK